MAQSFEFRGPRWAPELTVIEGPDARDFLNRLSSVPLNREDFRSGDRGFFLSATGQIESAFFFHVLGEERFALETHGPELGARARAYLEKFHFGEKLTVTRTATRGAWRWADARDLSHASNPFSEWGARLSFSTEPGGSTVTDADFERARIRALVPLTDADFFQSPTNPLELGLFRALEAPKGCYPGQEVIEKTLSLGSPARRLCLFEWSGEAPTAGVEVQTEAGPTLAPLTSVMGTVGMGIVRKTQAQLGARFTLTAPGFTASATIQKVSEWKS